MADITFIASDVDMPLTSLQQQTVISWLNQVALQEEFVIQQITYIFTSDEYVLQLNQQFLQHDYYTDILTFPLNENATEAEIYISIDRVADNADQHQQPQHRELLRVMVHGLLHLTGHKDESPEDKWSMRAVEDQYLKLWSDQF